MKVAGGWYPVRRELEATLDLLFAVQSQDVVEFDSLLSFADLDALGYLRNFPHLGCLMCSIDPNDMKAVSDGQMQIDSVYRSSVARMGLLPATCYKVYLDLRDHTLMGPRTVGCIAKCFRHEDKALDEYRDFTFTMKEFVCIANADIAKRHVARGAALIEGLLTGLGIRFICEVASDPFFDTSSSVATLSRVLPTKQEILFNGHAVASLNYHRNYFGRKFNITLDSDHIHTSCIAFGLERWLAMFREHFGAPDTALTELYQFKASIAKPQIREKELNAVLKE